MGLALAIVEVVELWSQEHILGRSGEVGVLKGVEFLTCFESPCTNLPILSMNANT
jgi:hypothetical protein